MNPLRAQSPLLKICLGLALIVVSAWASSWRIAGMILITGLFFLPIPRLLLDFLRTLAKLTVFIASYLLAGWAFHLSPDTQLRFLLRIALLLLISIWWVRTTSLDHLYSEIGRFSPAKRKSGYRLFIGGLLAFIPMFAQEFGRQVKGRKVRLSEGLDILEQTFVRVGQEIGHVGERLRDDRIITVKSSVAANLYACVYALLCAGIGLYPHF